MSFLPCVSLDCITSLCLSSSHDVLFIMASKHRKPTVKAASKRPCCVIDLEIKLKEIEDYEGGKTSDGLLLTSQACPISPEL